MHHSSFILRGNGAGTISRLLCYIARHNSARTIARSVPRGKKSPPSRKPGLRISPATSRPAGGEAEQGGDREVEGGKEGRCMGGAGKESSSRHRQWCLVRVGISPSIKGPES